MRNNHPPILIASPTRSGTTMLAWLLHLHGVWIGEAKITKAPETNPQVGTENTRIKQYLREQMNKKVPSDFKQKILQFVHTQDRWLVKTAANLECHEAWLSYFPGSIWLLPRRPVDEIVFSAERHPGMRKGNDKRLATVTRHRNLQNLVTTKTSNYLWVNPGALATGNLEEGRKVLDFCNIPFDPEVFLSWSQPDRWHGSSNSFEGP